MQYNRSDKYLICGKLYDYIRAGKYVLSIGNPAGLNSKIVAKEKTGSYCENTVDSMYRVLIDMYKKWTQESLVVDNLEVEKYSREYQNQHYV